LVAYKKPLLADDLEEIRAAGVRCVIGEQAMQWRRVFLCVGNTTKRDHRGLGAEMKRWVSTQDGTYDKKLGCDKFDLRGIAWQDIGRVALGERQDGIVELCFKMVLRKAMIKGFTGTFNQNEEDINFMASTLVSMEPRLLDCEGGRVHALLFICVSEIHRLMAAKGAAVDDKGLLQDAETIDEDVTTYIIAKEEHRQHVFGGRSGVTMLPRLGPAELHEVWKNEVLPFLQRAAADPTVLCDRRGWRQCYTSTATQQHERLNEAMHGVGNTQGGGRCNILAAGNRGLVEPGNAPGYGRDVFVDGEDRGGRVWLDTS
jgi:hypothetical protein